MGYDNIESPERIIHFTSNKKPKEARNMTKKSINNKFPLLYKSKYNPKFIYRVNGPTPPPPPQSERVPPTQSSVPGTYINPNNDYRNNEYRNKNVTTILV